VATHNLPHPAPDTVPGHRAAKRSFDAESKTALGQFINAKENRKVRTGPALSGTIDGIEVSTPHEPRLPRKPLSRRL